MQRDYFGAGTIGAAKEIATFLKARKILLVTGKRSFSSSGAESALYRCLPGLKLERFSEFDVNPCLEDGRRGVRLLQSFQPDLLIAVGGGSVIDMAKMMRILAAQPSEDYEAVVKQSLITTRPAIPLVAIPTTSGSGSEATQFSVVYIRGKKSSICHSFLLPEFTIIDPELTRNMGPYQSAVSGMDALCQGVESYWSLHSTDESRRFAATAIRSTLASLAESVHTGSAEARQEMARAAYYAGKAINITKTTAPHGLSYTLTAEYTIPHGHAVALMLGNFFLINDVYKQATSDSRGPAFFSQIMDELYGFFGCKDAAACAKAWYRHMELLGLETDLRRLGITGPDHHRRILESVNLERLANHPIHLTPEMLSELFSSRQAR